FWALAYIEAIEIKLKAEKIMRMRFIISLVFKEGSGEWGVGNGRMRCYGSRSPIPHFPLPTPHVDVSSSRPLGSYRRKCPSCRFARRPSSCTARRNGCRRRGCQHSFSGCGRECTSSSCAHAPPSDYPLRCWPQSRRHLHPTG